MLVNTGVCGSLTRGCFYLYYPLWRLREGREVQVADGIVAFHGRLRKGERKSREHCKGDESFGTIHSLAALLI